MVKFGLSTPNTLGEISGNVTWKLENVVTTLNKSISNVSTIFSYNFQTRYKSAVFSLRMRY